MFRMKLLHTFTLMVSCHLPFSTTVCAKTTTSQETQFLLRFAVLDSRHGYVHEPVPQLLLQHS